MSTTANIPLFLASFLRNPMRIGGIAPSSPFLGRNIAAAMLDSIAVKPNEKLENGIISNANPNFIHKNDALILELGAGTGAITREIVKSGIPPQNFAINEFEPSLYSFLSAEFPKSIIIQGDASVISNKLPPEWVGKIAVVVSSLPLRNFNNDLKTRLVTEIFRVMRPGGVLIQYTYPLACPLPIDKMGLSAELYNRVWLNLPPAAIWRFRKRRFDDQI